MTRIADARHLAALRRQRMRHTAYVDTKWARRRVNQRPRIEYRWHQHVLRAVFRNTETRPWKW